MKEKDTLTGSTDDLTIFGNINNNADNYFLSQDVLGKKHIVIGCYMHGH